MKKHKLAAVVGTLALTANLLLPGLAFGAQDQQGDLSIACSAAPPSFSNVPATNFNFYTDGVNVNPTSSSATVFTFSDDAGDLGNNGANDRYIEVQDVRDYNGAGECGNNGLTVSLVVVEDPDNTDAIYFDSTPNAAGGDFIPLTGVYFVTDASATTCPDAGDTLRNGLCFRTLTDSTTCQDGAHDCSDTASAAPFDATSTAFSTPGTFTTALGTDVNTAVSRTIINVPNGSAVYGKVGTATAFRADVPAFQPNGSYQLNLQYDVAPV